MTRENISRHRSRNIEDIAAKAGVSRATVSRVINNNPVVSEKTRRKVMAIIEREGFSPNPVARALVTQRTNVIGVVIPHRPHVLFEDTYYFPTLLHGISKLANERDYAILLWFGQSEDDEKRFYERIISNRLMDGVIIASARQNHTLIDHFLHSHTPFVLAERPAQDQDRISYVTIDNFAAAQTAVAHLITLGRTRIGTITGDLSIADGLDRLEGYKQALKDAGRQIDPDLIYAGNFTYQAGYEGMRCLLSQGIDAVFTASDITARGALHALDEAEVRVPQEVALTSIDDLPTALQVKPQLTTVHHPVEEKGAYAAEVLLNLIEDRDAAPRQILLPIKLVVRDSCGARLPV